MTDNRYYFDLLDDGLYRLDADISKQGNPQQLIQVLRFQFLLCALFHRTVIVPEQWLISSATFREVAFEVIRHWTPFVDRRTGYGEQSQRRVEPPIAFSFYDRGKTASPFDHYLHAFVERLESGRRVQQAVSLDLASATTAGRIRAELKTLLTDQMEAGRSEAFQDDFLDGLVPLIGEQPAIRLATVSRYVGRLARRHALPLDQTAYHRQLRHCLQRLKDIVRDPPFYAQLEQHTGGTDRLRLLRELFDTAERDKVQLHELTDLWRLIPRNLSEDSRRHALSLEAIGRAIMHRALKEESASDLGSLGIGLYRPDSGGDAFESDILRFVCSPAGHVPAREERTAAASDFDMAVLNAGATYDMAQRISWPEVWRDIWVYAYSEPWERVLAELRANWSEEEVSDKRREDALLSALDHINSHVSGFSFTYGGASQPYVHMLAKRLGRAADVAAVGDKAGSVADKVQKLFKLGDFTLTIGLSAFLDLAKSIATKPGPYRLMLRTERSLGATSRHVHNVWTRLSPGSPTARG